MKRRLFALCAGLLMVGLVADTALAAATLDQSNTATGSRWPGSATRAQTFMVGIAGGLTRVDLALVESVPALVTVKIETIDRLTGLPTGTVLAQVSHTVGANAWYEFDFSSPPSVLANARLAIVFALDGNGGVTGSGDAYSRGQALVAGRAGWTTLGAYDYDFKTYMQAPVPPAPTPTPKPKLAPTATATPTPTPTASPSPSPVTASSSPGEPATSATPSGTPKPSPASAPASGPASPPASGPVSIFGVPIDMSSPVFWAGSILLGLILGGLAWVLVSKWPWKRPPKPTPDI